MPVIAAWFVVVSILS